MSPEEKKEALNERMAKMLQFSKKADGEGWKKIEAEALCLTREYIELKHSFEVAKAYCDLEEKRILSEIIESLEGGTSRERELKAMSDERYVAAHMKFVDMENTCQGMHRTINLLEMVHTAAIKIMKAG